MSTQCQGPILIEPIKFLGASVISFNTNLGIGSASESTLTVDLIEDCEADPPDLFLPASTGNNKVEVGEPAYFDTTIYGGGFSFGGVLTSWSKTQGSSGRTFNVTVSDPRQLLQNVGVVVDSYVGPPSYGINYINVYAHYEQEVLSGNCNVFGSSLGNERGMPYQKVIQALQSMNSTIYSPTGYPYTVNWGSFPTGLPEYYRVTGPQTVSQLLQDVCDVLGFSFFVSLAPGNIITVGLIDLKSVPQSFSTIIDEFDGVATELSFGEELRNEVTKAIIFGEQQHYLTYVDEFQFYFGEDMINGEPVAVVPFKIDRDNNTFWINKKINNLNGTLEKPFPNDGPYEISELDIRAAMGSLELWKSRVFDPDIVGNFNAAIRANYPEGVDQLKQRINDIKPNRAINDIALNPNAAKVDLLNEIRSNDLKKIHSFIADLGNTYYGKQFITPLKETICYYQGENFQEKIFSSVPTNAGGWIDGDIPILGLADPDLGLYRSDDNRLTSFGVFTLDGDNDDKSGDEVDPKYENTSPPDDYSDSEYIPGGP